MAPIPCQSISLQRHHLAMTEVASPAATQQEWRPAPGCLKQPSSRSPHLQTLASPQAFTCGMPLSSYVLQHAQRLLSRGKIRMGQNLTGRSLKPCRFPSQKDSWRHGRLFPTVTTTNAASPVLERREWQNQGAIPSHSGDLKPMRLCPA
jgi:hypothetical protein